jgi:cell division protein FtsB
MKCHGVGVPIVLVIINGAEKLTVVKTLQEDIDDLDRMVDTDAAKDAIRSQIRLIGREIAALEADYSQLVDRHSQLQQEHARLQQSESRRIDDAWNKAVRDNDIPETYSDPATET